MTPSGKYELNRADYIKWGQNALIFLAPALVVLVSSVIKVVPADWKFGAIALYLLNVLVDILRKWANGK